MYYTEQAAENISDARIAEQIAVLNADFRKLMLMHLKSLNSFSSSW